MFKKLKSKRAFTLIELIVVMAVIGILVLLSMPKFMGYTKEAKYTKLIANTKTLEDASERYYMDNQDWPRNSDIPYTSDQIKAFAQKVYDTTGKEVILDSNGNYYDIDYSKLSNYILVPDDKMNYIIQNPVGNVYALEGLTKEAETRISEVKITSVSIDITTSTLSVGGTQKLIATVQPSNATNKSLIWSSSNESVATVDKDGNITAIADGTATITVYSWDKGVMAQCNLTVNSPIIFTSATFTNAGSTGRFGPSQTQLDTAYVETPLAGRVTSLNGIQLWTVPSSGKYKIEAYGAQGGSSTYIWPANNYSNNRIGGKGSKIIGEFNLNQGEVLKIIVGQKGLDSGYSAGGGGGTFVAKSDNTALIVAGGGAGATAYYSGANTISSMAAIGSQGLAGVGTDNGGGSGFHFDTLNNALAFINGGNGAQQGPIYTNEGGFGGGGAGKDSCSAAGGGGYIGGNGLGSSCASGNTAGISYNSGSNQVNTPALNTASGKVIITFIG